MPKAKRNVGREILDGLRELKRGEYGRDGGSKTRKERQVPQKPQTIGENAGEHIGHAFSDIELLAAAGVIKSAIDEGRKHVDQAALKRVYAKLMAAYNWRSRAGAAK
jgi:hypothetical protein